VGGKGELWLYWSSDGERLHLFQGSMKLKNMNLIELVRYFKNGGELRDFCKLMALDSETEVVEVFMKKPFSLDNELFFFEIEKTEGKNEDVREDAVYYNLFDIFYFLDAIDESKEDGNAGLSDFEISRKIFNYALEDA
jgi:hypothetical protein